MDKVEYANGGDYMFCKKCGAQINPDGRFCRKCGEPITATDPLMGPTTPIYDTRLQSYSPAPPFPSPESAATPSLTAPTEPELAAPTPPSAPTEPEPTRPAPPSTPAQPAPVLQSPPSLPSPAPSLAPSKPKTGGKRALWIILIALIAGGAIGYYFYSRAELAQKVERAIVRGDLLRPVGESAYDYYQQLRQSGMNDDVKARLSEKLLSAISRHSQMIADLAVPGKPDATLGEWQDAQKLMNWASELRPNDSALAARANYASGRVAYLSDLKDDAIVYWKRAAERDATWAMPLNSVGLIHTERKNYPTARLFFLEAIRREPQLALPYNNLGTSYLLENNYSQAESYYRQAIELSPQWPRPHAWLGEIAMRRKDFDWAVREFEAALDLDPAGTSGIDLNKIRQQLDQARRLAQEAYNNTLQPTPEPIQ